MAKVRKKLSKYQVDLTPVDEKYLSPAAMLADQANQSEGFWYYGGDFYYEYLGTTTGDVEVDYRKIIADDSDAIFVAEEDYTQIDFDRIGGYIYGTPENPLTDVQLSLAFTNSREFSQVMIYHQSDSVPTFDGLDTPNTVKTVGSYVTSELNRIVIIHEGNENITIGYINDSGGTAIQDGVEVVGTITIPTPTTADLAGFTYRIAGVQFTSGTLEDIAITGTPTNFPRTDFFVGKFNPSFPSGGLGIVEYIAGTESEDQVILPVIPPNAVLLGSVARNIDGSNDFEVVEPDLSDFVSKSAEGNQTIQSGLTIAARAGLLPNFAFFGNNGELLRGRPSSTGLFTTLQGIGGYSKILTITIDPANQVNYYSVLEFFGVSDAYEKGQLWIQFQVDGSGDIITNALKCFGEFEVDKYVLIKTSSDTYTLFVAHDEVNSFYKFRPIGDFGSNFRYEYHQLEPKVDPLPAGDQYFFTSFLGDSSVRDGLVDGGVVTWTGTGYVYDVSAALVRYLNVLLPWIPYDQVTLTAADATFPRKDVIVVEFSDSFTGFKAIAGPADSVDAVEPQLEDYSTQIKLTVIDVAAGSTTPSITGEQVYDENLEWDVESTGTGTVNPASVAAPFLNLYSIEVTNCQNGFRLILNRTTPFDYDSFDVQSLRLKQKSSLGAGRSLGVQFLDSANAPVTNIVPLSIVKADLNYQYLAVAKESFTPVGVNQAQKLAIVFTRVSGGATYSGFFVDDWKIQSGIISPPTTTTIQLTNEVLASGASNAPIQVSLTEKAVSNRTENTSPVDADMLLLRRNSDGALMKVSRLNFLKRSVVAVYANDAAMFAAQANQQENNIYQSGASFYKYKGTTVGDITDYDPFGGGGSTGAGAGLSIDGSGDIQLGKETLDSEERVIDVSEWGTTGNNFLKITNDPDSWSLGSALPVINVFFHPEYFSVVHFITDENGSYIYTGADSTSGYAQIGVNTTIATVYKSTFLDISIDYAPRIIDEIFEKGLTYAADYSTAGTADPRWIPDWGAVEAAIADATPDDYTPQTGTTLAFDGPNKYGFNGTPLTGNLTFASTGAKETVMIKALHNSGTEPTLTPPGGVTLIKEGADYAVSVDNILYAICHKNDAGTMTKISYSWTINQL